MRALPSSAVEARPAGVRARVVSGKPPGPRTRSLGWCSDGEGGAGSCWWARRAQPRWRTRWWLLSESTRARALPQGGAPAARAAHSRTDLGGPGLSAVVQALLAQGAQPGWGPRKLFLT